MNAPRWWLNTMFRAAQFALLAALLMAAGRAEAQTTTDTIATGNTLFGAFPGTIDRQATRSRPL